VGGESGFVIVLQNTPKKKKKNTKKKKKQPKSPSPSRGERRQELTGGRPLLKKVAFSVFEGGQREGGGGSGPLAPSASKRKP